jgi:hypothetical protein
MWCFAVGVGVWCEVCCVVGVCWYALKLQCETGTLVELAQRKRREKEEERHQL